MKLILLWFLVFFNPVEPPNQIKWISLEQAEKASAIETKPVLIDISAKWCKWCKVMDKETFSDPKVIAYINQNYYAVRLDYDRTEPVLFRSEYISEQALIKSWEVRDLPTLVIWKNNFEDKELVIGYRNPNQLLRSLKSVKN